jgi:hypothetical protein
VIQEPQQEVPVTSRRIYIPKVILFISPVGIDQNEDSRLHQRKPRRRRRRKEKRDIHELRAHGKLADFLDPLHFGARFCVLTHLLLFQHSHPMHICRHTATSTKENPETTDACFIHVMKPSREKEAKKTKRKNTPSQTTKKKRETRPGRKLTEMRKKLVRKAGFIYHGITPIPQNRHNFHTHFLLLLVPLLRRRRITRPFTPRHLHLHHIHISKSRLPLPLVLDTVSHRQTDRQTEKQTPP